MRGDLELIPTGQQGRSLPGHAVTVQRLDAAPWAHWLAWCSCGRAHIGRLLSTALHIEHQLVAGGVELEQLGGVA